MSLIAIIGEFDIQTDDVNRAAELMRTMMLETQKEDGCVHYAFSKDLAVANRFQLSELWRDGGALAAHFRSAHMASFRAGLSQLRVEKRTVNRWSASNQSSL